ncbi:MAG: peptidoglycan DD-metalloendopeptidase family protein [Acidobacteria bacterium]|nr:peptidoglycan DD-metalloendopeptidase family protein [Acidobacteriota bacterium]
MPVRQSSGALIMSCFATALLGLSCGGATVPVAVDPATRLDSPGIYHTLQRGETLFALSRTYGVPVETLIHLNAILDPADIPAGTPIFVPGARRVLPVLAPGAGRPPLSWPLAGKITARFGPRGRKGRLHEGIDIDGDRGDPIRAAAPGLVEKAGTGRGYGKMIVINHGDGLSTLYAHASDILVRTGQRVVAGERIARVGRTGNARGTHLHFEVRRRGHPVDPLVLLGRKR